MNWYCTPDGCTAMSCVDFLGRPDLMNPNCTPALLQNGRWVKTSIPGWGPTAHGSWVADLAGGSIEYGENPSITDPSDQIAHSGAAPGAWINLYYMTSATSNGTGAFDAALVQATENGDNVISTSCGVSCDPNSCPPHRRFQSYQ
jgi:hypothetical protein